MHLFTVFYTPVFFQDEKADNSENSRSSGPHNSGNDDVAVAFFPYNKTNRCSDKKLHKYLVNLPEGKRSHVLRRLSLLWRTFFHR